MDARRLLLGLGTVALVATAPASAFASGGTKVYAPPGKAGSSEYSETVPTSGGNVSAPTPTAYTPTPATKSSRLVTRGSGRTGVTAVSKLGSLGQTAAGFAQATAPTLGRSAANTGTAAHTTSRVADAVPSGSALSGVLKLLGGSDSGGIGIVMPVLMLLALIAAILAGVNLRPAARRGVPGA